MSLKAVGFIRLPGGERTSFDHADTYRTKTGSRVYVAHPATNAIDVIDCGTGTYLSSLADLPGVAGVLIDSEQDLLFTSDRGAARVSIFRCTDDTLLAQLGVGSRPNGLAFDPRRRTLYSFNLGEPPGTGCTASVISVDDRRVAATLDLPGRPRWAVFDRSTDSVYVNIQDPAVIVRIDAATRTEAGRIDVGAAGPHGLAVVGDQLWCAADGRELTVIDRLGAAPRVTKRLPLGGVPDVVMYDATGRRLYVAVGSPGLVTVFDTERLEAVETVETDEGAHTIGWDPVTRHLYAFAPLRGGALVFEETA